jgi:hypothetical protein
VTLYLIREWQKLSGNFVPRNVLKMCEYHGIGNENPRLVRAITGQKAKLLCINDENGDVDADAAKQELDRAFRTILPQKSSFEK